MKDVNVKYLTNKNRKWKILEEKRWWRDEVTVDVDVEVGGKRLIEEGLVVDAALPLGAQIVAAQRHLQPVDARHRPAALFEAGERRWHVLAWRATARKKQTRLGVNPTGISQSAPNNSVTILIMIY